MESIIAEINENMSALSLDPGDPDDRIGYLYGAKQYAGQETADIIQAEIDRLEMECDNRSPVIVWTGRGPGRMDRDFPDGDMLGVGGAERSAQSEFEKWDKGESR